MLSNYISDETMLSFLELCEERDASPDVMLKVMVAGYRRRPHVYGVNDTLQFGKYHGLTLMEVIVADPAYAKWMWKTAEGVDLDDHAKEVLRARLKKL